LNVRFGPKAAIRAHHNTDCIPRSAAENRVPWGVRQNNTSHPRAMCSQSAGTDAGGVSRESFSEEEGRA